ncbi:hypothetical protein [Hungatella hathewayi]|nr:hypothetical protein [Enterocloster bolteae]
MVDNRREYKAGGCTGRCMVPAFSFRGRINRLKKDMWNEYETGILLPANE